MMWFERLTGFRESSPQQVRENISVEGVTMKSHVNAMVWPCGHLETPSLGELRRRVRSNGNDVGRIKIREVVANVRDCTRWSLGSQVGERRADSLPSPGFLDA